MVAAAPYLMMAAAGASAAGAVAQGVSQMNADRYNSQVASNEANAVESATASQATQEATQTKRQIGASLADAGASGVDPSSGSPLAVMSDTATQGELNRQLTIWQGGIQGSSLRQQGLLDKFQGNQALQGGIASAAGTLLSAGAIYAALPGPGGGGGSLFPNSTSDAGAMKVVSGSNGLSLSF
jgi:hypothetical protein